MKHSNFLETKKEVKYLLAFIFLTFLFVQIGCDKNKEADFNADFSYVLKDANHVEFTNQSTGEYYSLSWDFGNGTKETTTDKKKTYTIFYPAAGDYDVTLRLTNYSGSINTESKTVTITEDDLSLDVTFTAEVDPDDPNIVNLKNTTEGEYDSFKWVYRNLEVENLMEHQAYFPYAGDFEIELIVTRSSQNLSDKQSVTITQDDPDYVEGLIWSDEFEYTGLPDPLYWNMETGGEPNWGNNELQYYTDTENNAKVENGVLTITARKENLNGFNYTSARITTQNKFDFKYGRIEARIKLPYGQGLWPAFWLLGDNINSVGWPACGEIDIMEMVGGTNQDNTVHSTLHWDNNGSYASYGEGYTLPSGIFADEFHIFTVVWDNTKITAFMDDTKYFVIDITPQQLSEFHQNFFTILNLAVGGNWPGSPDGTTVFPQTMEVDYVRVFQDSK